MTLAISGEIYFNAYNYIMNLTHVFIN